MSEAQKRVDKFQRDELKRLLSRCTEKQIKFFNRIYGNVNKLPQEKIPRTFQQIEATLKINRKDRKLPKRIEDKIWEEVD